MSPSPALTTTGRPQARNSAILVGTDARRLGPASARHTASPTWPAVISVAISRYELDERCAPDASRAPSHSVGSGRTTYSSAGWRALTAATSRIIVVTS